MHSTLGFQSEVISDRGFKLFKLYLGHKLAYQAEISSNIHYFGGGEGYNSYGDKWFIEKWWV